MVIAIMIHRLRKEQGISLSLPSKLIQFHRPLFAQEIRNEILGEKKLHSFKISQLALK